MALGGVYDQIAGGFHRYSVDERWLVPHFEKMSYDNSELLRNYLHGYQVTAQAAISRTAEGIIAWVDEVLSDRERGGFYASQDADQTLEDDGDYFTWTLDEVRAMLPPEEARVIELYYDVGRTARCTTTRRKTFCGSPQRSVESPNWARASTATRTARRAPKRKLLAARPKRRPTPVMDTTIYIGWNAMFVSAYLEAARVLGRDDCRAFALRTLDRSSLKGGTSERVSRIASAARAWKARWTIRYSRLPRCSTPTRQRSTAVISRSPSAPCSSPSNGSATLTAADFSTALKMPRPWAASTCAASHCRIRPRRAPIPSRRSSSTGCTLNRRKHSIAIGPRNTLEAFAGLRPQYGLFAATYASRRCSTRAIRSK